MATKLLSKDELLPIAQGMLSRSRSESPVCMSLSGGLFLSLERFAGELSLCLLRDAAPGPSPREVQICRSAFGVPVAAEGAEVERSYVVRWPVPVALARPAGAAVVSGFMCGSSGCQPFGGAAGVSTAPAVPLDDIWYEQVALRYLRALVAGNATQLALADSILRGFPSAPGQPRMLPLPTSPDRIGPLPVGAVEELIADLRSRYPAAQVGEREPARTSGWVFVSVVLGLPGDRAEAEIASALGRVLGARWSNPKEQV